MPLLTRTHDCSINWWINSTLPGRFEASGSLSRAAFPLIGITTKDWRTRSRLKGGKDEDVKLAETIDNRRETLELRGTPRFPNESTRRLNYSSLIASFDLSSVMNSRYDRVYRQLKDFHSSRDKVVSLESRGHVVVVTTAQLQSCRGFASVPLNLCNSSGDAAVME